MLDHVCKGSGQVEVILISRVIVIYEEVVSGFMCIYNDVVM